MSFEPGSFVGPYEILGSLGRGGMGSVFRAMDSRLHREVALKVLHDDLTMPGMHERFLREARAISSLNHPNIRTIFDIGDFEGDPYMVMELLDGETLRDRIDYGALPVGDVVAYGMEATDALIVAHAKGIIHRDIKPANIFLVPRSNGTWQVKVLDFGLAKIEKGHGESRHSMDLTVSGSTVGTVSYMSPEQARGEPLDARSDLFSLGVMLYEMATGEVPFGGNTSAVIFVNILSHNPPPMRDLNNSVPKDLERIILKLLEKDRKDRYQNATELYAALEKVSGKKTGGFFSKSAPSPKNNDPAPAYPKAVDRRVRRPSSPAVVGGRRGNDLPARHSQPFIPPPTPPPSVERSAANVGATEQIQVPSGGWAAEPPSPATPPSGVSRPQASAVRPTDVTAAVAVASGPVSAARPATRVSQARPASNYDDREDHNASSKSKKPLMIGVAAVVLVAAGAFGVMKFRGGHVSTVISPDQTMLITSVQNQTGDSTLTNWIEAGIALELSQSSAVHFRGPQSFRAALQGQDQAVDATKAKQIAEQTGAPVFLYGTVAAEGAKYKIDLFLNDTASNATLATFSDIAASKEQIGVTLDRLAQQLRQAMGESYSDISKTSVAFNNLATSSQDAVRQYAEGELAFQSEPLPAIRAYEQAIASDSNFAQPQMKLAMLYGMLGADDSAADSAKAARDASGKSGEKTSALGAIVYEVYGSGNLTKAADLLKTFSKNFPNDADCFRLQAAVSRKLGRWQEALQAAQQGLGQNPGDGILSYEAEMSMIGLNRYEAALELNRQGSKESARSGNQLVAAYLQNKTDQLNALVADAKAHPDRLSLAAGYANYLDNAGKLQAGAAAWKQASAIAGAHPKLTSAAAFYAAQSALNRALLNSCPAALSAMPASGAGSTDALYSMGMAAALCGNDAVAQQAISSLQSGYAQNTAVQEYMIPTLKAATQLKSGQAAAALDALNKAKAYDTVSIAPYLRGLAQVSLGKSQIALVDHQMQLQHRGSSVVTSGTAYPAAQLGLAHAYEAMGDKNNAAHAYKAFADLWKDADPGSPLLSEAKAKGH